MLRYLQIFGNAALRKQTSSYVHAKVDALIRCGEQ